MKKRKKLRTFKSKAEKLIINFEKIESNTDTDKSVTYEEDNDLSDDNVPDVENTATHKK